MIDLEGLDAPLNHVEFYKLNYSLAFIMRNPVSKILYELLNDRFDKVLLSFQDNCAFLPTEDAKKTIRDVYMMLREPEIQECGIMLVETKPSPIFFGIEADFLKCHGYSIEERKTPFFFHNSTNGADMTVTLLKSSIEIKCIEELSPFVEKIGISYDPLIKGYSTNHTLVDEIIYEIYKVMEHLDHPRIYKIFKNTKPNFPENFRDAFRADTFFNSLFGNQETTASEE